MAMAPQPSPIADRELVLTRILAAPRAALYRCWTEPELLKQWFCPPPWRVSDAVLDVRPGGANLITMRGPNGEVAPNAGVYLDVIPNEKVVFTDAFTADWQPSGKPFMVATITFQDHDSGGTLYTATARHWSAEDCKAHADMGFHTGWGIAADQLEALAKTL